MKLYLDEEKQSHLYSCLLAGGKVWANMKKGLEKLERPTTEVDRELELNAALRMELNPKAEEIARARERKDPAQQDFTEGLRHSSGETGGGIPAGQVVKLRIFGEEVAPTDAHIRDALLKYDRLVLLTDIAGMTSSERDSVMHWVNEYQQYEELHTETEPDEPECLALVAMSQESIAAWSRRGPYVIVEMLDGKPKDALSPEEPTSFIVQIPGDGTFEPVIAIDTTDGVEAEVKQARANRVVAAKDDMDDADIEGWLNAGPWKVEGVGDPIEVATGTEEPGDKPSTIESKPTRWYVSHEESDQRQRVIDEATARATAAKYNRNFAGKDEQGEWRQPPEVTAADLVPAVEDADDEDGGWMTHKDDADDLWETDGDQEDED